MIEKKGEDDGVHLVGFGKGEGFSYQPSQALAQGAVEAFNMVGVSFGLALGELVISNDFGIRFPNISKTMRCFVGSGNGFPQRKTRFAASVTDGKGHHLPGASTERQPNPAFVFTALDKTPNLVQFQFLSFLKLVQCCL